jgi:hypothetical protein
VPGASGAPPDRREPAGPERAPGRSGDIWRESLLRTLPEPVDFVFASEPYGERLASRARVRASCRSTRRAPSCPSAPPPFVQDPLVRVGRPAARGAAVLREARVPDGARVHRQDHARGEPGARPRDGLGARVRAHATLAQSGRAARARGLRAHRARAQLASEQSLARGRQPGADLRQRRAHHGALRRGAVRRGAGRGAGSWPRRATTTSRWSRRPDVPYVPEPLRFLPHAREALLRAVHLQALEARGRRYLVLSGGWAARRRGARAAVDALAGSRTRAAPQVSTSRRSGFSSGGRSVSCRRWRRFTSIMRVMAESGRSLASRPKGFSISSPTASRPKNA